LLPGIDDGAKHLRTACDLRVRFRLWSDRDHHYTPYYSKCFNTHEGIASKKVETIQQLEKNNITIPFQAAAEYLMDDQFVRLLIS
jgi:hypothetical protein